MNFILSKSRYLNGLQCKKLLWYQFNAKDKIPSPSESTMTIFEQGHQVGELAKKLFPKGIEVDHSGTFKQGLDSTRGLLAKRSPIFEAAFSAGNCYFRADILEPVGRDEWNIIEVKSSSDAKDINYYDIGFQYYTAVNAGLKVKKCFLMCVNKEYVRSGELEPKKLFKRLDVTAEVKKLLKTTEKNVADMLEQASAKKCPELGLGNHCKAPFECPMQEFCRSFLPERHVLLLYNNKKLPFAMIKEGIYELSKIDPAKVKDKQKIQINCEKTGKPHIDKKKINNFFNTIKYPAYYLDFETWMSALPMFDGGRPYETIPFQFSLHLLEDSQAKPKHYSFLFEGTGDPRPEFINELKKVLGTKGSVIAFNAPFEVTRLNECAKAYPEHKKWVESVKKRVVDLIQPFRDFAYYHPNQNGSCSLKKVLPVLTDKSYKDMEIGDGGTASSEYFRVTFTKNNSDRAKVRELLEDYCELDTLGMVEIVKKLEDLWRK